MSYTENLLLFFTLLFGIIIVPGMDMTFVVASSLAGGRSSGLSATAGIVAGGVVHTLYAALGVGILLQLWPAAFDAMLIAGAAYIAWIGWTLTRSSITVGAIGAAEARPLFARFRQGALTCLLNPKAYLFMLAVYPQFLKPEYGPIWLQASVLALMIALMQITVYGGLAIGADRGRAWLLSSPRATTAIGRLAGFLLIAIALTTAWHGWRPA